MHLLALVIANRKTYKCRAYLKHWEGVEEEAEDKSTDHYGVQSNVYLVVYVVNRNLLVVLLLICTGNTEHVSWKLRPVREWPTTTLTGIYPYIHISIIFVQPLLSQRHKRREREGQATRVNTTIMETRRTTIAISVRNTPFPGFGVRTRRKTATANEMVLLGDAWLVPTTVLRSSNSNTHACKANACGRELISANDSRKSIHGNLCSLIISI